MKILIITQHIFPIQTPRAHRSTELAKELAIKGHEVTLYAVLGKYDYSSFEEEYGIKIKGIPIYWQIHKYSSDGDNYRNIIDKILGRMFGKILEYPNLEFFFRVIDVLSIEKDYDVLISIGDPHQIHWGCAKAKRILRDKFPKIWIADCGDPFMNNGNSKHLWYFKFFEKFFCKNVDYITVPVEEAKNGYFQEYRSKIKIIPQGFKFDINKKSPEPNNNILTFAYAGTFYRDIRNPSFFFEFLSSLNMNFRFHIFTRHDDLVLKYTKTLKDKLIIHNPINRSDLIERLEEMDFLINFENINSDNQIPSKIIDYAISQRPILSVSQENFNIEIVNEFFLKDYKNKLGINNLDKYHISNVVELFEELFIVK